MARPLRCSNFFNTAKKKIILVVLQIRKQEKPKTYQHFYAQITFFSLAEFSDCAGYVSGKVTFNLVPQRKSYNLRSNYIRHLALFFLMFCKKERKSLEHVFLHFLPSFVGKKFF
jgi:hypothetical protein